MRIGLGRFGRENIQDAAAQRVFADHFHRVALLVADAFQMRQQIFERDLFAHAQRERELPVKFGGFGAQQRGRHRRDGDAGLARRQPPQPDGALLADFAVRRQALRGKHVQAGMVCGRGRSEVTSRSKNVSTSSPSVSACLLPSTTTMRLRSVACHSSTRYSALAVVVSPESDRRALRIANQPADDVLKRRVAAERLKQIADGGMSHETVERGVDATFLF